MKKFDHWFPGFHKLVIDIPFPLGFNPQKNIAGYQAQSDRSVQEFQLMYSLFTFTAIHNPHLACGRKLISDTVINI